jgi:CheY-like chemotaxis protein
MEYVEGSDLASTVQKGGPLPVREAVDCIRQAASALAYAHGQGMVHRDIKPANLLRDRSGTVKVADLGLARFNETLGGDREGATGVTQPGGIVGTADYMSPEQAFDSTNVDHRADIYSLGCTLFYLLTGKPPFPEQTLMAVLLKHRQTSAPSLSGARPGVPASLDAIFQRMMAKSPADRYPSMAEVVEALDAFLASEDAARPGLAPATVVSATAQTLDLPSGLGSAVVSALLVEPSRAQSMIIRQYLMELGVRDVQVASGATKALEALAVSRPTFVVSALHLAEMTGAELVQNIRGDQRLASTGCILISSQSEESFADAGAATILHKPFGLWGLYRALSAASGSSRAAASRVGVVEARVLVVDDSVAARAHFRGVLSELGFKDFAEAADGVYAVALLQSGSFDLVVTDYNMPRMDGLELVTYLRQRSNQRFVPVVMVTTETDSAKLEAVRRLGVSAICDKTFPPETVRKVVDRMVRVS